MSSPSAPNPPKDSGENVSRRAGIVLSGTLLSRILGAVRDAVIAACFSVPLVDAWVVAFTIPNSLRVLLGEGAVGGAFIPVFSEAREREGLARAREFYRNLTGVMMLVLLVVTVIGILTAPQLVSLYAHGFRDDDGGERFALTVTLTQVVFPYIFLMGLAALGMGALNSLRRFAVPAFAPALLNVAMIAAPFTLIGVAAYWSLPAVAALAIGALIGGALQVLAQFPELRRMGLLSWPRLGILAGGFRDPYVRKAFKLLIPLLVGLGVYQVNILLSRLFASYLEEGAMSYLYFGQRLVEIPQGMFALAIATASLPTLADLRNKGRSDEALRMFRYALRHSLFLAIPAAVALFVLAEPCVAVLFGRGAFGPEDIAETARSLRYLALGIWAVASVRTVVPMFLAYNDTKSPVLGAAMNLVVFGGSSWLLMPSMQHAGIALAGTCAAAAQLLFLVFRLRMRVGPIGLTEVTYSVVRVLAGTLVMGALLFGLARLGTWDASDSIVDILLFAGLVSLGAVVFLGLARLMKAPEVDELASAFGRRLRR